MTDSTQPQTTASKAPTHIGYHVKSTSSGKDYWTRIGAAWSHASGNGFNIQIDTVPLDGRITLLLATEKHD